jgi:hypothetical protein
MSETTNDFLLAQPTLSRFNPMKRIMFFDDFDNGINGWTELIGNYEDTLDSVLPPYRDHRPPSFPIYLCGIREVSVRWMGHTR